MSVSAYSICVAQTEGPRTWFQSDRGAQTCEGKAMQGAGQESQSSGHAGSAKGEEEVVLYGAGLDPWQGHVSWVPSKEERALAGIRSGG